MPDDLNDPANALPDPTEAPEPKGALERLQRPLHRRRERPRSSPPILGTEELKQRFNCSKAELPARMDAAGVRYHRDSTGSYWAALEEDLPEG